jgi:hypothetical protein
MGVTPGCPPILSLGLCGLHDTVHRFLCQLFLRPDTQLANNRGRRDRGARHRFAARAVLRGHKYLKIAPDPKNSLEKILIGVRHPIGV